MLGASASWKRRSLRRDDAVSRRRSTGGVCVRNVSALQLKRRREDLAESSGSEDGGGDVGWNDTPSSGEPDPFALAMSSSVSTLAASTRLPFKRNAYVGTFRYSPSSSLSAFMGVTATSLVAAPLPAAYRRNPMVGTLSHAPPSNGLTDLLRSFGEGAEADAVLPSESASVRPRNHAGTRVVTSIDAAHAAASNGSARSAAGKPARSQAGSPAHAAADSPSSYLSAATPPASLAPAQSSPAWVSKATPHSALSTPCRSECDCGDGSDVTRTPSQALARAAGGSPLASPRFDGDEGDASTAAGADSGARSRKAAVAPETASSSDETASAQQLGNASGEYAHIRSWAHHMGAVLSRQQGHASWGSHSSSSGGPSPA